MRKKKGLGAYGPVESKSDCRSANRKPRLNLGAGERSRTSDLLITNQLLYQLSYTSLRGLTRTGERRIIAGNNAMWRS